jgi:hypothetical protein
MLTDEKQKVAEEAGVLEAQEQFDKALSEFRLLPENAIPIPPTIGKRFSDFYEASLRVMEKRHRDWTKNIKLFLNEEAATATSPEENLVRTTIESLVDYTYMRNPQAEVSSIIAADKELSIVLQKLLHLLINKKTLPGINLRPKVLKQIIFAHLTNFGILELTYQDKKGSLQQVLEINEQVKQRIKETTDADEANPLYELLDILQRELDVRKSVGIGVRVRSPFSLLIDPNCQELDLSDCKIIMDRDYMKIDHIIAEYMIYDAEQNTRFFRYKPDVEFATKSSTNDANIKAVVEADIVNQLMPDVDNDQAKLRLENTMPVVWVYDRTTRLKYLYLEGRWDVPLWVYEDEMQLSRFYPFFLLAFSASLNSVIQAGEVSHYISFQEEINKINKQTSLLRARGFTKYLYNASLIDKGEVERLFDAIEINSTKLQAIGIKVKDNEKPLSELLEPLKVPSAQFKELFDKRDLKEALDRTTRITDAMRGAQFRTNTTNDAVETYNEFAGNRLEGLTDKIELCVEELLWSMCELIVSKMGSEEINMLLTTEDAKKFRPMSVTEFNAKHHLTIAAGSTEKPTSNAKKKEAAQIIQMLTQFGTTAPRTVLTVVTRLLRSAFSRNLVTDDDLTKLEQEGVAAMQKGISTQAQPGQPAPQQQQA